MAISDVSVKNGKKLGSGNLEQEWSHSVGTVRHFHDKDDIMPRAEGAHESGRPAKRRKSALIKEPKVLGTYAENPQEYAVGTQGTFNQSNQDNISISQLTTPPNSTKRPTKKGTSAVLKNRTSKLPPFKALSVTKPIPPLNKHPAEDKLPVNSIVKLQEWTTTQEAMKNSGNGISPTTLDKLSAFRYRSSSTAYSTQVNTLPSTIIEAGLASVHDEELPPAKYNLPSSKFFQGGMGNEIATAEHPLTEQLPYEAYQDTSKLSGLDSGSGLPSQLSSKTAITPLTTTPYNGRLVEAPIDTNFVPKIEAVTQPSLPGWNAQSSDPLAYGDSLSYHLEDYHGSAETQHLSFHGSDEEHLAYMDGNAERILENSTMSIGVAEIPSINTSDMNSPELLPENGSRPHSMEVTSTCTHFKAERSGIDDEVPVDSTSTCCNLREFDEGLDDKNFLVFATDSILPDMRFPTNLKLKDGGRKDFMQSAEASLTDRDKSSKQVVQMALYNISHLESSSLPVLDDGFPIDVEEANALLLSNDAEAHGAFEESESLIQAMLDEIENEGYDSSLQFSPPNPISNTSSTKLIRNSTSNPRQCTSRPSSSVGPSPLCEAETWEFLHPKFNDIVDYSFKAPSNRSAKQASAPERTVNNSFVQPNQQHKAALMMTDDTHEYEPLQRLIRYEFPQLMQDRCPVIGLSKQTVLRVCFHIGEMFREEARCAAASQDAIIELFARVSFSAREPKTTKQQFQFADLWTDKPPFVQGILANFRTSELADTESKRLIQGRRGQMVRCLGRLKRAKRDPTGWLLHIINIRETDWEEIRWTERIVSAGVSKPEPAHPEPVTPLGQ
ncbi:hypothetical protein BGZ60DRAFT_162855 [Tricladium varicosporioides]|nr:hypothetical protein BGZ60DRAFT_162855 [Hymenoscyphus varicosporioides]